MNSDKSNQNEQQFVTKVCEALDASVERVNAETTHKIIAARQQALAQQKQNTLFALNWSKATLATALSIFVAVLIVKTQLPTTMKQGAIEEESIEAMELMAAQDTFDMYEELEFYTWLAEEDVAT